LNSHPEGLTLPFDQR